MTMPLPMNRRVIGVAALLSSLAVVVLGAPLGCANVELETPRAYPCADEGEADECPEGWRCGLDKRCHDTAVPAAYLCTSDDHCEGGWRCGADESGLPGSCPLSAFQLTR